MDQKCSQFIDEFILLCEKHNLGLDIYADDQVEIVDFWDTDKKSENIGSTFCSVNLSEFKGLLKISR